jgi:hypothetical protein
VSREIFLFPGSKFDLRFSMHFGRWRCGQALWTAWSTLSFIYLPAWRGFSGRLTFDRTYWPIQEKTLYVFDPKALYHIIVKVRSSIGMD